MRFHVCNLTKVVKPVQGIRVNNLQNQGAGGSSLVPCRG